MFFLAIYLNKPFAFLCLFPAQLLTSGAILFFLLINIKLYEEKSTEKTPIHH